MYKHLRYNNKPHEVPQRSTFNHFFTDINVRIVNVAKSHARNIADEKLLLTALVKCHGNS